VHSDKGGDEDEAGEEFEATAHKLKRDENTTLMIRARRDVLNT
jgi:hypothetical protein